MNTKIKLLNWLFLSTLFFTFSSCEKDLYEEPIQEQTQQNIEEKTEGKINYVTIDDVPFLKPTIKKFQAKNKLTAKSITNSQLDLEHIIEYEGADNYKSYSIAIDQEPTENGDYYFENLNVIKNGDKYETFILRYNPDNDTQLLDFSNFTGRTEFFTNEEKPVGSITFQNSTAKLVQQAIKSPSEDTSGGGGCGCGPSMIENLFNWIGDAIKNVSYAISGIKITAYSNAGNNGYNYNPYVLTVTPPQMGTSTNPNSTAPSSGNSTVVVSPNEPIWSATTSQKVMAQRLSRRIDFNDPDIYGWLLDPKNAGITESAHFTLWEDNTLENREFVKQAIQNIKVSAEVDFGYKVIIDGSIKNNPCLFGVYTKLGKAPTFQSYLQKFDGNFSVANLRLSVGIHPNYPKANAVTIGPQNYLINIMFNPENLHRPSLDIARTFIHEMIHAEMYRKLLSCSRLPHVNINNMTDPQWQVFINNLKDNFPGLFDYYMRYEYNVPRGQQVSDAQHQAMAQHYRQTIIQVLKQFDNSSHSNEFYNALAWIGLMGEGNINNLTGLPPNPSVTWKKVPQNERLRILSIFYNFIETNTPCQ